MVYPSSQANPGDGVVGDGHGATFRAESMASAYS
jgi:hypothetical protein